VGVGLNVTTREFPPEIAERATSLALLRAEPPARETLLLDLLAALATRLHEYERTGVLGIARELNEVDALRGARLGVDGKVGIGRGLDEHGFLLIEDDFHTLHAISSGTVELIHRTLVL
jgi:BirA family biotin operon repressor/biotin-[acetyl-CoA-carboxylase] ligase